MKVRRRTLFAIVFLSFTITAILIAAPIFAGPTPPPMFDVFATNDPSDVEISDPVEFDDSDPIDVEGTVTLDMGAEVAAKVATETFVPIDYDRIPAWSGSGDYPYIIGSVRALLLVVSLFFHFAPAVS